MALNKKSCIRIAAIVMDEFTTIAAANSFTKRITNAADTDNKSFRKTMRRIAKAIRKHMPPKARVSRMKAA